VIEKHLIHREALISSLPDKCAKECTLAKYVITELCKDQIQFQHEININAARALLAECIDGPMPVGSCGTEKKVCAHPVVDSTTDTMEQPKLFADAIWSL